MGRRAAAAALGLAALPFAAALPSCDTEATCTFTTSYKGGSFTYDLRGLCNRARDYRFPDWSSGQSEDSLGHTYYAQICGTASQSCLPKDWQSEYEYGRAVQSWGSAPDCDFSCYEEGTEVPVCCTAPCSVIAVSAPQFNLLNPGKPEDGFELVYTGETPTGSDPYSCDYNPDTFQPYPRETHMQFVCDPKQDGFARFVNAWQNTSDDCYYQLTFATRAACLPDQIPLSGGWIFNILVFSAAAAYLLVGGGLAWHFEKRIGLPSAHLAFWSNVNDLAFEGLLFVLAGFKKPTGKLAKAAAGEGGGLLAGAAGAADAAPFKATESATAASSESVGGGYQSGAAADAPAGARAGYTDL